MPTRMKSSMWLLDPRPDLPTIVRMVEKGFELSEASHAPVMMELRIRACHVTGEFAAKDNTRAAFSGRNRIPGPPRFEYAPARASAGAVRARAAQGRGPPAGGAALSSASTSSTSSSPAISTTSASSSAAGSPTACCARSRGSTSPSSTAPSRVPIHVLNVRLSAGAGGSARRSAPASARCWWSRKARPTTSSSRSTSSCAAPTSRPACFGKGALPKTGDYTSDVLLNGLAGVPRAKRGPPASMPTRSARACRECSRTSRAAAASLGDLPVRPPTFCTGCPERPVFSAIKLMQRELGPTHISGDIGCHAFATFAPFSMGNSILGYGMSLASAAAVTPNLDRRPIAVMGDGGFWHNGLITGVTSNLFNKGDGVLDRHAERLRLRHRPAISAVVEASRPGRRARHGHRDHAALARRHLDAQGAHLLASPR